MNRHIIDFDTKTDKLDVYSVDEKGNRMEAPQINREITPTPEGLDRLAAEKILHQIGVDVGTSVPARVAQIISDAMAQDDAGLAEAILATEGLEVFITYQPTPGQCCDDAKRMALTAAIASYRGRPVVDEAEKLAKRIWDKHEVPIQCEDNYEIVGVQFSTQAELVAAIRAAKEGK